MKLKGKVSRPVSRENDEDSNKDDEDSEKSMKESHESESKDLPGILAAASDATVRLKSTSRTHTLTS